MSDVKLPRIYLIQRSAAQSDPVQRALNINPVAGVFAASPEDAKAAEGLSNEIYGMRGAPLGIVAKFEHPLVAINEDGTVEIVCPAPEQSKT